MKEEFEQIFHYKISTGSKKIDEILDGGFLVGSVVGIAGEANSGKSAIARSFAINALKMNKHKNNFINLKVLHLSTEGDGFEEYITALSNGKWSRKNHDSNKEIIKDLQDKFGHKFLFKKIEPKINELYLDILNIYKEFRFNMIVLDVPTSFLNEFLDSRAGMFEIIKKIKKIAINFDCIVICPFTFRSNNVVSKKDHLQRLAKLDLDVVMLSEFNRNGNVVLSVHKGIGERSPVDIELIPNFQTMNWIE